MPKLYLITIRWNDVSSPIPNDKIEAALGTDGEWLRFSNWSWLSWTNRTPEQLRELIKPILGANDTFFIGAVEPRQYQGFAPQWVWDWMYSRIGYPT